ncbi:aminopeptidase N-like [Planococcus citri]|uniref:aminopeptidase N-like n=1 Tax=Planococcus citri TaxID=170843 RepID=UPI0031F74EBA
MTHIPEVLEVMEGGDNSTSKKTERVLRVPYILVIFVSIVFLLSLLVSTFLFYKYMSCCEENSASVSEYDGDFRALQDFHTAKSTRNVRLPRAVVPDSYRLKIIPFIWEGNFTFNGEVSIVVNITESTKNITLHSLNLNISQAQIFKLPKPIPNEPFGREEEVEIYGTSEDKERQFFILHFDHYLEKDSQYRVFIRYDGIINDNLQGFYRSSYKMGSQTRWIAVTQFQATDARQAFPCFDEPAYKAKFTLSIARLSNMTTLSNMRVSEFARKMIGLPPDYVVDIYEESVPMSTYLVAFAVVDFYQLSETKFHVWARQEAIDQARYALTVGSKVLTFYEDYFDIKFPLPKMDMIALPDFNSGAMENWGLITFRETTMLYKEGVSTRFNKEDVATVVAHELAHQWFGNLVTPDWWSDLWLNEGFATYMEYIGTDNVEPTWKILDQFVVEELQSVLNLDALVSSHPISVQVSDPDEINEIFDGISYSKGASIIRMMDHFLTNKVFKQGLSNYLTKKAYHSATQDDLWDALTEEAHRVGVLENNVSVKQIMDTWTLQIGFPVITITRNYHNNTITVTQSRFFMNSNNSSEEDHSLWWVPLTYTSSKNVDFSRTKPSYWLQAEPQIFIDDVIVSPNDWLIFNVKQTGYYRVNYDDRNWELLVKTLNDPDKFGVIDPVNRAQIINDALKLAHSGILKYSTALDITLYLQYELEYVPWMAAFGAFEYLNEMLRRTGSYDKFKDYLLFISSKLYENTGFFEKSSDDQLLIYKRVEVVNYACKLGYEDCIRNAVNQFQSWKFTPSPDNNNPISPNLKGTVYCTAIRVGGEKEWDFAWQRYLKSNVGSEKDILLGALGCSRETWILSRYLDWALNETSGIKKQDVVRVFSSVANNVIGQPLAWAMLRDHWDRVVKHLGSSLFGLSSIVKSVLASVNTEHEIREIADFFKRHKNETGAASRAFIQAIEKARSNEAWMSKNYDLIVSWLSKHGRSNLV